LSGQKANDVMKIIAYINAHKVLVIPVVFGLMWFYGRAVQR